MKIFHSILHRIDFTDVEEKIKAPSFKSNWNFYCKLFTLTLLLPNEQYPQPQTIYSDFICWKIDISVQKNPLQINFLINKKTFFFYSAARQTIRRTLFFQEEKKKNQLLILMQTKRRNNDNKV